MTNASNVAYNWQIWEETMDLIPPDHSKFEY